MDRIEEILKQKGLSKAAFAELMGTSRQNVNALLKNPTRSKLMEIASALGVPVWQLFASPEEVVSQEFVAFFHFKGKSQTPATLEEMMCILREWQREKYHQICHRHDFEDMRERFASDESVMRLLDSLSARISDAGAVSL